MSFTSSNPFALLSEDPFPAAAPAKAAPKKADAPKPREVPGAPKKASRKGPAPAKEESFAAAGNVPRENKRAPRGTSFFFPYHTPSRSSLRTAADHHTGEARGRGRGGRARGGGHGRQFDRHSATAHTDSAKIVEQGWGGSDPKRELEAEAEGKADAKAEEAAPANPAPAAEEAPVEPEETTLTLDEYLASLAEKKAAIAGNKKDVRQVDAAPDAAKKVTKATEAEESYFAAVNKEKAHKAKKDKAIEQIDTAFSFAPPSAGRGRPRDGPAAGGRGRGAPRGRGAGRGRGGRTGAPQGARQPNVNLGDAKAFPSLGA